GDVLCPDGRRAGGCLDAPVTIDAIRWYTGWMTRQGIAPRTHNLLKSVGDDFRLFNGGRVAMMTTGHSWVPRLRPYVAAGRMRFGFVGIPHRAGVRPATAIYASGYAVPPDLLDRITLAGADPGAAAHDMARQVDRVLGATR